MFEGGFVGAEWFVVVVIRPYPFVMQAFSFESASRVGPADIGDEDHTNDFVAAIKIDAKVMHAFETMVFCIKPKWGSIVARFWPFVAEANHFVAQFGCDVALSEQVGAETNEFIGDFLIAQLAASETPSGQVEIGQDFALGFGHHGDDGFFVAIAVWDLG